MSGSSEAERILGIEEEEFDETAEELKQINL